MMRPIRWLLPHPFLTLLLTAVWILLQNKFSAGMLVFGLILGVVIPILTARWWTDRAQGIRPLRTLAYVLLVIWDIVIANIQVAWIILTKSNASMSPAWVVVPLDLKEPEAITILMGTITLTPGTVSADLSDNGRYLLVHALDASDPDAVRDEIKDRYERRLKEIFV
ncbi:Na+/H+ antiporter subunit E [Sulfitobacter sp. KE29]|uniref:Na+/H+ antiporter subunit E n=1 Tax=Sulfitobacter TaxID=60136 RepID=UPI0007C394A3|nr:MULTISPECIES: Na+/H+ antiporter subunit E [Sulfitobacter]KZY54084.1 cation:proton antiporter [Sulfitobacter sp. HI0054]MBO9431294.1 Na+/H+ antiporter subunit E [Sulfitobacter sp. R18_1]MBO9439491.1 Na+/H+ antiporter subunit E [Sulfitobacter sp. R18_2]MDF3382884.1 Na+/H+ antiporter subunit E [Sulfitobacter sp. Ks11]MDF3386303.1 Na+/H+ antiporter subunit E [Sulfitobacter sp. M85]